MSKQLQGIVSARDADTENRNTSRDGQPGRCSENIYLTYKAVSICLLCLINGCFCGPTQTELCTVTQGALLGGPMWNHPCGNVGVGLKISQLL